MVAHHGFELFDVKTVELQSKRFRVEKTLTFPDLCKRIASEFV
jgi:hypothetical protein